LRYKNGWKVTASCEQTTAASNMLGRQETKGSRGVEARAIRGGRRAGGNGAKAAKSWEASQVYRRLWKDAKGKTRPTGSSRRKKPTAKGGGGGVDLSAKQGVFSISKIPNAKA